MRAAILTLYYRRANYGALLQAWALQKTLEEMGVEARQIAYVIPSGEEVSGAGERLRRTLRPVRRFLESPVWFLQNAGWKRELFAFAGEIPHTRRVTAKGLGKLAKEYDVFVCGSDQIWNPVGWQPAFFLDFVPEGRKKVAYAASVSRDRLSEGERSYLLHQILDFRAVSVRERKTADQLRAYPAGERIRVMPDPVFLRSTSWWEESAAPPLFEEPYLFAHFLGPQVQFREAARRCAAERGLRLVYIPHMLREAAAWEGRYPRRLPRRPGVPQFLSLVRHASLVLTDSFHATAFSLLYRTPFYTFPRFREGDPASMNLRVRALLEDFHLSFHLLEEPVVPGNGALTRQEADRMECLLREQRFRGLRFLTDSVLGREKNREEPGI